MKSPENIYISSLLNYCNGAQKRSENRDEKKKGKAE